MVDRSALSRDQLRSLCSSGHDLVLPSTGGAAGVDLVGRKSGCDSDGHLLVWGLDSSARLQTCDQLGILVAVPDSRYLGTGVADGVGTRARGNFKNESHS